MEFVENGDFRKARRVLKPIKNSFCTTESIQATSIIYAEILKRQGKYDEAISKIKGNICYMWNRVDGLMILNCKNPKVDISTSLYLVEVYGGSACLGALTTFPENYKTSYQVFAQTEEEIRERILELEVYQHPKNMQIRVISFEPATKEHFHLNRGVVKTFPFEKCKKD
ncbi:MAG: hypothetical protein KDC47_09390, partial [Flavobacteriaceae bacterium]|nr:hypothetical protein [Flavobacteriaceae bacterium]